MKAALRNFLAPFLIVVVVIALWQFVVIGFGIRPFILPAPSRTALNLWNNAGPIFSNLLVTLSEILGGFAVAVIIAFGSGVSISYSQMLRRSIYPLIVLSHAVPIVAVAPILIIWFGYSIVPRIIITALIAYFPMVVSVVTAFDAVDKEQIVFFRSMNAKPSTVFFKLALPTALPNVFAGLKVTSVLSVVGAIVSEWIGADRGLGHLISSDTQELNTERVFASITVLAATGMALFTIIVLIEWACLPWQYQTKKTSLATRLMRFFKSNS